MQLCGSVWVTLDDTECYEKCELSKILLKYDMPIVITIIRNVGEIGIKSSKLYLSVYCGEVIKCLAVT